MRTKPILREQAAICLRSSVVNAAIKTMEEPDMFPFQTCLMCDHFNEAAELCKLYNARPPARVIAFGCDKFDDANWIPF